MLQLLSLLWWKKRRLVNRPNKFNPPQISLVCPGSCTLGIMEQNPSGKPMEQLILYLSTSQPGHLGKNTITSSRKKSLQIRQKCDSHELNYQNPTYPTLVLLTSPQDKPRSSSGNWENTCKGGFYLHSPCGSQLRGQPWRGIVHSEP